MYFWTFFQDNCTWQSFLIDKIQKSWVLLFFWFVFFPRYVASEGYLCLLAFDQCLFFSRARTSLTSCDWPNIQVISHQVPPLVPVGQCGRCLPGSLKLMNNSPPSDCIVSFHCTSMLKIHGQTAKTSLNILDNRYSEKKVIEDCLFV